MLEIVRENRVRKKVIGKQNAIIGKLKQTNNVYHDNGSKTKKQRVKVKMRE